MNKHFGQEDSQTTFLNSGSVILIQESTANQFVPLLSWLLKQTYDIRVSWKICRHEILEI